MCSMDQQADFSQVDYSRLARKMAQGLPQDIIEDALQQARLGVLMASRTYDPARNTKPSTWAYPYVLWQVGRYVAKERRAFQGSVPYDEWLKDNDEPPVEYESRDVLLEKLCERYLTDLEWGMLSGIAGLYDDPRTVAYIARENGISRASGYAVLKSARTKMRARLKE